MEYKKEKTNNNMISFVIETPTGDIQQSAENWSEAYVKICEKGLHKKLPKIFDNVKGKYIYDIDFSNQKLNISSYIDCDFVRCNFEGATLNSTFNLCNFEHCNFKDINICDASFADSLFFGEKFLWKMDNGLSTNVIYDSLNKTIYLNNSKMKDLKHFDDVINQEIENLEEWDDNVQEEIIDYKLMRTYIKRLIKLTT